MRPRSLCNKLNEFFAEGLEEGVFLAVQTHLIEVVSATRELLGPAEKIGMLSDYGVSVPEYIGLLDANRYSAVFDDLAILTIECRFETDRVHSHRYSYIPCPVRLEFTVGSELLSTADWVRSLVEAGGVASFKSVGTYRFDFDPTPTKHKYHPVSHFTFAAPSCRLPVRSPLSIAGLLDFLFDNFYRRHADFWNSYAPHLNFQGVEDTITAEEMLLHHLSWSDQN